LASCSSGNIASDSSPKQQLALGQIECLAKFAQSGKRYASTVRVVASPESISITVPTDVEPSDDTFISLNIDVFNADIGSAVEVGSAISHTVFHKNFLPVSLAYDTSIGARDTVSAIVCPEQGGNIATQAAGTAMAVLPLAKFH
jgi:hypothetical protein